MLSAVQVRSRLGDAPRIGQQLLDHPAELVQLITAGYRQIFDQLDTHGHILSTVTAPTFRPQMDFLRSLLLPRVWSDLACHRPRQQLVHACDGTVRDALRHVAQTVLRAERPGMLEHHSRCLTFQLS